MVGFPIHEILEFAFFLTIKFLAGEMTVEYQERVLAHVQAIDHAGILAGILGHLVIPFKWNVFRPPDGVFAVERLFDMSWFPVIPSVGVNVFHHGSDDFPHSPVPDL